MLRVNCSGPSACLGTECGAGRIGVTGEDQNIGLHRVISDRFQAEPETDYSGGVGVLRDLHTHGVIDVMVFRVGKSGYSNFLWGEILRFHYFLQFAPGLRPGRFGSARLEALSPGLQARISIISSQFGYDRNNPFCFHSDFSVFLGVYRQRKV